MDKFPCIALIFTTLNSNELYCTALHYISVHYTALHYPVLQWTELDITALHCTAPYCTISNYYRLDCTALHCTTLHYTRLHCKTLHQPSTIWSVHTNHLLVAIFFFFLDAYVKTVFESKCELCNFEVCNCTK